MDNGKPILELRFRSRAEQLQNMRRAVRKAVEPLGFSADDLQCIILAVNEACMNIIQHAYGTCQEGDIILEIFDQPQAVLFRLTDFATSIKICNIKSRNLEDIRPGGLGVHLIQQIMDHVEYHNDPEGIGNTLLLQRLKR